MDKTQKKIIFFVLLIVFVITFLIHLGMIYPFIRYVLRQEAMIEFIYMIIFIIAFIIITGCSIPIVNFLEVRKAWLIYMPFLLINLGLALIMSSYLLFLISAVTLGIGFAGTLFIINFALNFNEEGDKTRIQSCVYALILSLLIGFILIGLSWMGLGINLFASETDVISPGEILRIRLLMMIFPASAILIGIIVVLMEKG